MGWRKANDDTLPKIADATFRVRLHNKNNKLIYFEHGLSGNDPSGDIYVLPVAKREIFKDQKSDTTNIIFSDESRLFLTLKNKTQKVYTDTISGYLAKIFEPIKFGTGYTGVYVEGAGQIAGNIAIFVAYGENPDSLENLQLLEVIKSIKLKPFD
ncbi:MAG: hypothetical protein ACT4OJ_10220 [Bacteroidota bacterium]